MGGRTCRGLHLRGWHLGVLWLVPWAQWGGEALATWPQIQPHAALYMAEPGGWKVCTGRLQGSVSKNRATKETQGNGQRQLLRLDPGRKTAVSALLCPSLKTLSSCVIHLFILVFSTSD